MNRHNKLCSIFCKYRVPYGKVFNKHFLIARSEYNMVICAFKFPLVCFDKPFAVWNCFMYGSSFNPSSICQDFNIVKT